jgi:putative acetyltransferase
VVLVTVQGPPPDTFSDHIEAARELQGFGVWAAHCTGLLCYGADAMRVRLFRGEDNAALARIFAEAVRATGPGDYSPQQLEVWAGAAPNLHRWRSVDPGRVVFVAEEDAEVAGFAAFEPDGHIDHLYVHPQFQRRGAASALLLEIEKQAHGLGIGRIFAEASITARPFFQQAGFRVIAAQRAAIRGTVFVNLRMEKCLI